MWREFVELAEKKAESFTELCARFGISRKTGYKWVNRFRSEGAAGLRPQSRRPKTSPRRTPDELVDAILALRREHADWSAARIHAALAQQGRGAPAPSTIDLILRRHREAAAARVLALGPEAMRYEPNYRWVLRLGCDVRLADGTMAAAATVRDETTDFIVGTALLTIRRDAALESFFLDLLHRHGLPWRARLPRDPSLQHEAPARAHAPLSVALIRHGILVEFDDHATPPHDAEHARAQLAHRLAALPAYQRGALADRPTGADLLAQYAAAAGGLTAESAPAELERLREVHNFAGRQEAMQRRSPISLYRPSSRQMPVVAPAPRYGPHAVIRLVSEKGIFTFQRRLVHVGRAFAGLCVELKPTPYPDRYIVLLAGQLLGLADMTAAEPGHTASLLLRAP